MMKKLSKLCEFFPKKGRFTNFLYFLHMLRRSFIKSSQPGQTERLRERVTGSFLQLKNQLPKNQMDVVYQLVELILQKEVNLLQTVKVELFY